MWRVREFPCSMVDYKLQRLIMSQGAHYCCLLMGWKVVCLLIKDWRVSSWKTTNRTLANKKVWHICYAVCAYSADCKSYMTKKTYVPIVISLRHNAFISWPMYLFIMHERLKSRFVKVNKVKKCYSLFYYSPNLIPLKCNLYGW